MNALDPRPFVVFYVWQSDLPEKTNRYLVRDALNTAAEQMKDQLPAAFSEVIIDEATRDVPGSQNIPALIQQKIQAADAVICDVTTVLRSSPDADRQRAAPNPNVVFELGVAVALHGWERVVLLFNKEYSRFEDLPFDFDRHRAASFRCPDEARSSEKVRAARTWLIDFSVEALRVIIAHNPPRPADLRDVPPEQIRRRQDVQALGDLVRTVHWPTLDEFVENAPRRYARRILYFHARFDGYVSASLFHLHDERARELVDELARSWDKALEIAAGFVEPREGDFFVWPNISDLPFSRAVEQRAWDAAVEAVRAMAESQRALLHHVRTTYPEIDIGAASSQAWAEYREYQHTFPED